jgi:hypothetical protein
MGTLFFQMLAPAQQRVHLVRGCHAQYGGKKLLLQVRRGVVSGPSVLIVCPEQGPPAPTYSEVARQLRLKQRGPFAATCNDAELTMHACLIVLTVTTSRKLYAGITHTHTLKKMRGKGESNILQTIHTLIRAFPRRVLLDACRIFTCKKNAKAAIACGLLIYIYSMSLLLALTFLFFVYKSPDHSCFPI